MQPDPSLAMRVHGCIAHVTDLHCNPLGKAYIPQGRTDTYQEDCLSEWHAFRHDCHAQGVSRVVMSGDFFNLKDPRHYDSRDLLHYSRLVGGFEVPWDVIPGNHDLRQSSMDHFGDSPFRALVKMTPCMSNVMDSVSEHVMGPPANPFSVFVSGAPYAKLEETFEVGLPDLDRRLEGRAGYRIALVHTDAMPPGAKPLPGHWEMASYADVMDALPSAHLICGGHIHNGSVVYRRPHPRDAGMLQMFSKPFSFGRVVRDYFATTEDLELQHVPTYTLVRFRSLVDPQGNIAGPVEVDTEERVIPHTPFRAAFILDSLRRILERESDLMQFVETLGQRQAEIASGRDLVDVDDVYRSIPLPEEVRALVDSYRTPVA